MTVHDEQEEPGADIARAIGRLDLGPEPPSRDLTSAAMRQGTRLRRRKRWTAAVTAAAAACVTFGVVSQTVPGPRTQPPATIPVMHQLSAADLARLVPSGWGSVSDALPGKSSADTGVYTVRRGEDSIELAITVKRGGQKPTYLAPLATVDRQGECARADERHVVADPWGNELSLCRARFPAREGTRVVCELFANQGEAAVGVSLLTTEDWTVQAVLRPSPSGSRPWISTADLYTLASDPRLLELAGRTR